LGVKTNGCDNPVLQGAPWIERSFLYQVMTSTAITKWLCLASEYLKTIHQACKRDGLVKNSKSTYMDK